MKVKITEFFKKVEEIKKTMRTTIIKISFKSSNLLYEYIYFENLYTFRRFWGEKLSFDSLAQEYQ